MEASIPGQPIFSFPLSTNMFVVTHGAPQQSSPDFQTSRHLATKF